MTNEKLYREKFSHEFELDHFRTSEDLQPGKVVNIYRDFKFQKKFEERATLIERKSKELTFILHDENLLTKPEERSTHEDGYHLPFTPSQKKRNQTYARLTALFIGTAEYKNEEICALYKLLCKTASSDLDNPKKLLEILNEYEQKWRFDSGSRGMLFAHNRKEDIVRFIQQTALKNWSYSIWREERWLVSFDQDHYANPFTTIRKIRTLICINPKEDGQNSDILHYVTRENSTVSNEDRRQLRLLKKEEADEQYEDLEDFEEQESYYSPEEIEMMQDTVSMDPNELDNGVFPSTEDFYGDIEEDIDL